MEEYARVTKGAAAITGEFVRIDFECLGGLGGHWLLSHWLFSLWL
jgi:hypothetical protein